MKPSRGISPFLQPSYNALAILGLLNRIYRLLQVTSILVNPFHILDKNFFTGKFPDLIVDSAAVISIIFQQVAIGVSSLTARIVLLENPSVPSSSITVLYRDIAENLAGIQAIPSKKSFCIVYLIQV